MATAERARQDGEGLDYVFVICADWSGSERRVGHGINYIYYAD